MKSMILISVLLLAVLLPARTESQPRPEATQDAIVALPEPVQEEVAEETWQKFVGQKKLASECQPQISQYIKSPYERRFNRKHVFQWTARRAANS